jgi:hypothetical protein
MFPYSELRLALDLDIHSACAGFSHGAPVSSDMDISEIRLHMLDRSFFKKLAPKGLSEVATTNALEKFKAINAAISTDPFEYPVESEMDATFWGYFQDNILKSLSPVDVELDTQFLGSNMAAGPGSSLGCDNESFYTKAFASRISVSCEYLLMLYRAAISYSDTWADAERVRFERFGVEIASRNRLFFVPKTAEIARTCCTEPFINMMMQQSIGAFLEVCLARSFGISLSTQPDHNRELARLGSLDGSFGTIDLQSASDSISWSLVRRVCRNNRLLGLLSAARCERTVLPDGTEMDLNMISTMGNGFTFPLQTIIFACVVRSVYQMMSLSSHCPKSQFGVFGDDIIVRREAYDFVIRCLTKLGFKVNDTKSFSTGSFRESCGFDFFSGHYVRGVFVETLETVSDVYSAINRLNRWSALSGVPLKNCLRLLRSGLRKTFAIPFSEAIDGGIQTPFRWTKPRVTDSYWFAYRKLANCSRRRKVPLSVQESVSLGYKFFNACGLELAFLGGYARSEVFNLKSETGVPSGGSSVTIPDAYFTLRDVDGLKRKKVVRGSIPYWDWLGPKEHNVFFSFSDWEVAFAANL